jgi:hypothetical protein
VGVGPVPVAESEGGGADTVGMVSEKGEGVGPADLGSGVS